MTDNPMDIVNRLRRLVDEQRGYRNLQWHCLKAADEIEVLREECNRWKHVAELFGEAFAINEYGQYVDSDGSDVHRAVLAYERAKRESR